MFGKCMYVQFIVDLQQLYDVCNSFLFPGFLCVLCVCGIYIRHHLPSIHPRPMAVFRCQHLRVGPVCLAHRSVQDLFLASQWPSIP